MFRQNNNLRRRIVDMVVAGKDGHIPSAFSVLDIIERLYNRHLKFRVNNLDWEERDYFVLSKGHGCLALYVVLEKYGIIKTSDIDCFCTHNGILGEHPDTTKIPGVEASTGSLGHGLPFAAGIALGLKIRDQTNKVVVLCGDGECQEGTVWEAANIATNQKLHNLCVIVDWNKSAAQLMPIDDLPAKWEAFGWDVSIIDGHNSDELDEAIARINFAITKKPSVIIANTIKGKGVACLEGHGQWHHRVPNKAEYLEIMESLL